MTALRTSSMSDSSTEYPNGAAFRVSVVMPAYNAEATIAESLQSLVAQTYAHWEAIVVDDGSTDRTPEIAAEFLSQDDRFSLVRQANGGEAAARNAGIAEARCDWLLFLDADDWIAPNYMGCMIGELAAHPEWDAVICRSVRVAPDGTQFAEHGSPPVGDLFDQFARRAVFNIHACVVRKALVDEVGRFDATLERLPDWDLWQRIARTGAHFGGVSDVLAFYRMRPTSISLDAYPLLRDGLRVLRQGHSSDARVSRPHPDHAAGLSPDGFYKEQFYFLSWCAGLMLGRGDDARALLNLLDGTAFPELYPDAVAECLFGAAALPTCRPPQGWEELWPTIKSRVGSFLAALEERSQAVGLAHKATLRLQQMILRNSGEWKAAICNLEADGAHLKDEANHWRKVADDRAANVASMTATLERSEPRAGGRGCCPRTLATGGCGAAIASR